MLNAHRDLRVAENVSVYGSAGLELARLESKGWQSNESRQYGSETLNRADPVPQDDCGMGRADSLLSRLKLRSTLIFVVDKRL